MTNLLARRWFAQAALVTILALSLSPGRQPMADDATNPPAGPAFAPTCNYEAQEIEGWPILVNRDFPAAQPELCAQTLALLQQQLFQVPRSVPAEAVGKLRQVTIWVELAEPHHPCMAYHPDPGWLTEHGMNPEKARCVELANAANFLDWTKEQPWMVFHELAHAYHHQFLPDGFENAAVRHAHGRAAAGALYDEVLRASGRRERAYALTNPMEYFAEQSEAYFGTNDFFPFVRAELEAHDPHMTDVLKSVWGVP
jgi:hypothetical protein